MTYRINNIESRRDWLERIGFEDGYLGDYFQDDNIGNRLVIFEDDGAIHFHMYNMRFVPDNTDQSMTRGRFNKVVNEWFRDLQISPRYNETGIV